MKPTIRLLLPCLAFILLVSVCLLAGCAAKESDSMNTGMPKPSYMVMIDDVVYAYTGHWSTYITSENPEHGGHYDGETTSTVDRNEFPTENNQSNFGIGYPYRYGEDNTIEVFFSSSERWKIFEPYEATQAEIDY